jgi:hypothetical protein
MSKSNASRSIAAQNKSKSDVTMRARIPAGIPEGNAACFKHAMENNVGRQLFFCGDFLE